MRRRGKANGGVGAGGAAVEARFDGGLSSPAFGEWRWWCPGSRVGESANERREKKEGVLLVLMRTKGESGGL